MCRPHVLIAVLAGVTPPVQAFTSVDIEKVDAWIRVCATLLAIVMFFIDRRRGRKSPAAFYQTDQPFWEYLMIRRPNPHRRNPRQLDPSQRPALTYATGTPTVVATKLQLDLNVPITVVGTPAIQVNGHLPTGVVVNGPTRLTLTYATAVATGQTWSIPANDPSMRTQNGGYVAAATGTF
jgi:hypothetical protein